LKKQFILEFCQKDSYRRSRDLKHNKVKKMGNVFSDMIGIDSASQEFSSALKDAATNATATFREVALTGISYIQSFTPIISLLIVFLVLLLLVLILHTLGKMLKDLEVSSGVRALVLIVVSIVLYSWFVGIQIVAAVTLQTLTTIVIAIVCAVGFAVIAFFVILFIYRVYTKKTPNPFRAKDPKANNATNQATQDANDKTTAQSARKSKNAISPEPN
jgi:flagellar biosynthesis/type III secretory pathway M-ring protein FliF/YscJ